jgi:effector-binding domain-containing protein
MVTKVVYRIEVRDVPEQIVGCIRGRVRTDELDRWIAAAIQELFTRLADQGVRPAGTPFAMMPAPAPNDETLEVAVALPATRRVAERGRVEGTVMPACRALVTLHRGPYDELAGAYRALAVMMYEQGIEPIGEPREVYLTNPEEASPDDYETEVLWPVDVPADWVPVAPRVDRPLPRS